MSRKSAARAVVGILIAFLSTASSQAQVVLDGTLRPGNEGVIPPNESAEGEPPSYLISQDLGIVSGNGQGPNLLHSFFEFSLEDGARARFTAEPTIETVIARVTGGSESVISGMIDASETGDADLFFVNPAGVTFRNVREDDPGNKIDVPGSFFASTADALLFEGGERFDARGAPGTEPSSILTLPSAWEFSSGPAAEILVDQTLPLAVRSEETLSLVGGHVRIERAAFVSAEGGSLELVATGSEATQVPVEAQDWVPTNTDGVVDVSEFSTLQTSGTPGGRIVLRGGRLVIDEGSVALSNGSAVNGRSAIDIDFADAVTLNAAFVDTENLNSEGAGAVRVRAGELILNEGARIRSQSGESSGALTLNVDRLTLTEGSEITARVLEGRGGNIDISAQDVVLSGGAAVRTQTFGGGRAGDVRIGTNTLSARGSGTFAGSATETGSSGNAGDVSINADLDGNSRAAEVTLLGGARIETVTVTEANAGALSVSADRIEIEGSDEAGTPSGFFSRSVSSSTGDSGTLRIDADDVLLTGAGTLSTRSFGTGRAGTIEVVATNDVVLRGGDDAAPFITAIVEDGDSIGAATSEPSIQISADQLALSGGATISSESLGAGEAGDVEISARTLLVTGERIPSDPSRIAAQSSSFAADAGDGGQLRITLTESLEVSDGAELSVRSRGPGAAGSIEIETGTDLLVRNGGTIRSAAEGIGDAGDLNLRAGGSIRIESAGSLASESTTRADAGAIRLRADDEIALALATIDATANAAAGANIEVSASRRIRLDRSRISTSVEGRAGEGNAGNLTVDADQIDLNESELLAQATLGDGGNIELSADRFVQSAESLVDASSSAGIDGIVEVEAPDANLRSELARLTGQIIDPTRLLRAPCAARASNAGSFVVSHPEGIPASPIWGSSLPLLFPLSASASAQSSLSTDPEGLRSASPSPQNSALVLASPCSPLVSPKP